MHKLSVQIKEWLLIKTKLIDNPKKAFDLPCGVDGNLLRFFACCNEDLKELHKHGGQEFNDDLSLHSVQALPQDEKKGKTDFLKDIVRYNIKDIHLSLNSNNNI